MHRFTKIVCTIGPATSSVKAIKELIRAGMDVARLNFSHGTGEEQIEHIRLVRRVSSQMGREVAILQDLPGPKLRIGNMGNRPVMLNKGATVTLSTEALTGSSDIIPVSFTQLPRIVHEESKIYLADGTVRLRVNSVGQNSVKCEVEMGGFVATGKGINIPRLASKVPALTQKDLELIKIGVENSVDYVAVSFVSTPEDMHQAKNEIRRAGGDASVISKIEKVEAAEHCKDIISASDAVMVARGDLGVELGPEKVPMVQKKIIHEANRLGKPVITATQILLNMLHEPTPTRAEVSDIANAILDGTDALMLSEETAVGPYYKEAVETLARVSKTVEHEFGRSLYHPVDGENVQEATAAAACQVAAATKAKCIVAYTWSGATARVVSKNRTHIPICSFSPVQSTVRQLCLVWGVESRLMPESRTEISREEVEKRVRRFGFASDGDRVVVVAGFPTGRPGTTNMIRVQDIGDSRAS